MKNIEAWIKNIEDRIGKAGDNPGFRVVFFGPREKMPKDPIWIHFDDAKPR